MRSVVSVSNKWRKEAVVKSLQDTLMSDSILRDMAALYFIQSLTCSNLNIGSLVAGTRMEKWMR